MNRKVYSADVLEKYILMFIKDGINYLTLVKEYGLSIHNTIFYQYVNKYRKYGLEVLTSSKNRHFLPISFPQILLDKIRHLFLIKNSLPMFHSITFIVHLNKLNPMEKVIQNRCCDPFIA